MSSLSSDSREVSSNGEGFQHQRYHRRRSSRTASRRSVARLDCHSPIRFSNLNRGRSFGRDLDRRSNSGDSEVDPLLISKFDNPTTPFIPLKLNRANRKQNVCLSLGSKSKLGFIDGSCFRPEVGKHTYRHRLEKLLYGTLLASCFHGKSILDSLAFVEFASHMWKELVERFYSTNGSLFFKLRRSLVSIQQGQRSVGEYYSAIKKMWDEIVALDVFPKCECGVFLHCRCDLVKKMTERDARYQVIDFLTGLNIEFDSVRSTILAIYPMPSANKAFYLVQQIEQQKCIFDGVSDSVLSKGMTCSLNKKPPLFKIRIREHYNFMVHSKDRCYKHIGFPDNWKFNSTSVSQIIGNSRVKIEGLMQ